jgi:hypothetical protein
LARAEPGPAGVPMFCSMDRPRFLQVSKASLLESD